MIEEREFFINDKGYLYSITDQEMMGAYWGIEVKPNFEVRSGYGYYNDDDWGKKITKEEYRLKAQEYYGKKLDYKGLSDIGLS